MEIVDPRTLYPLDVDTILESVKKTGKLVIAEEGVVTCGVGAEIAALAAEHAFGYLDAPILRVGTPHVSYPFNQGLEWKAIPDEGDVIAAGRKAVG